MAQKKVVELIDDIDGTQAAETVTFGIDGVAYEIDLNEANAQALRDHFAQYVQRARRAGRSGAGVKRAMRSARPARAGGNPAEVREWARQNGFEISERGRIPSRVLEAFDAAH